MRLLRIRASIAIENARLFDAERRARARSDALRKAAQIVSSKLSQEQVFEAMLEQMARVFQFDGGNVMLVEDGCLVVKYARVPSSYQKEDQILALRFDLSVDSGASRVIRSEKTITLSNVQEIPWWQKVEAAAHVNSWMGVPLIVHDEIIGLFSLDRVSLVGFTTEEAALGEEFVAHVSAALENARLFELEEQRVAELEALRQASLSLTASLELNDVLDSILESVLEMLPSVRNSHIFLYHAENEGRLSFGASLASDGQRGVIVALPRPQGLTYAVARSGEMIAIEDMGNHALYVDAPADWEGAILGLPLKIGPRVVGVMNISYGRPRSFSDRELHLVRLLGDQAAIAIENARLFEALQRRAEEAEALRQASAAVAATLDKQKAIAEILKHLQEVVPYDSASVQLIIDNSLVVQAGRGLDLSEGYIGMRFSLTASDPGYEIIQSRQPVIIANVQAGYPAFSKHPHTYIRGWMGIPLLVQNEVVGIIALDSTHEAFFTEEYGRLAVAFANQIAIALENARLFEQAETERAHMSLLYEVGRSVSASLDSVEIMQRAISLTVEVLGGAVGQAFMYLPEETELRPVAIFGPQQFSQQEIERAPRLQLGEGLAGYAALHDQSCYLPDLQETEHWLPVPGVDAEAGSAISSPIRSGDRMLGALTVVSNARNAFSQEQLHILEAICQEVGLALTNAWRYQQVQRRLAEMTLIQILTQTFNQRLHLQVLLDEVVVQLANRLKYPQIRIFLVEEQGLVLRASHGPELPKKVYSLTEGIIGLVARTGDARFLPAVMDDAQYKSCIAETVAEIAVPIFREKAVVGVINVETADPEQLTAHDYELLQMLAGQIAVALENAVLFERARSHAEELRVTVERRTIELRELYNLSQEIGYASSFERLLEVLLPRLRKATQMDYVQGYLQIDGQRLRYWVARRHLTLTAMQSVSDYLSAKFPDQSDILNSTQMVRIALTETKHVQEDMLPIDGFASTGHVPLYLSNQLVGMLFVASVAEDTFTSAQERLLITFGHQAETALERVRAVRAAEQRRLAGLVEHLPLGVLLFDDDNRLSLTNPEGELILNRLPTHYDDGELSQIGEYPLSKLIQLQTEPIPIEIVVEQPVRRIYEVQARQVGTDNQGWILMLREVTQEREYQNRIQMQERLATVGQLAAGIAHDFNNIMAAILVYTDLLLGEPAVSLESQERLNVIQQQVQRAASLIRQILDFSRRGVMEQSTLDLLPFLKELDKMLGRVLPETIRVELTYSPGSHLVRADPTRLQQVFINLALNARDAMPAGGLLRFRLERIQVLADAIPPLAELPPGEWVMIEVADTGVGIPPDVLPHIFEPFFTTKPVGQGTGLGLAQVYGIIRQHDGFIDMRSTVGDGTQAIIFLPLEDSAEHDPGAELRSERVDGEGRLVLVVEDDPTTRSALEALLTAHNYRVLAAANGEHALDIYAEHADEVVLIVSDIVMPNMGGLELYNNLLIRWPSTRILFVTGHPLDNDNQALLEAGNVCWLQKPFSVREFIEAVETLINSQL